MARGNRPQCKVSNGRVFVEIDTTGKAVCTHCGSYVNTWPFVYSSGGDVHYYSMHILPKAPHYGRALKASAEAHANKSMLMKFGLV